MRPLAFTWPVYRGARIPRWKLGAGLTVYDALALFRNVRRHRRLSARGVLEREPGLSADGLRGGALYYDAATNDARLTLANAIGASERGAVVLNHARVDSLIVRDGRIVGARVADGLSGLRSRRTRESRRQRDRPVERRRACARSYGRVGERRESDARQQRHSHRRSARANRQP